MSRYTFALVGMIVVGLAANSWAVDQPKSIDDKATHVDSVRKIEVPKINAFSVTKQGKIVAACALPL